MNKISMELVWHNCKTRPPTEKYNPCLYITDGTGVIPVMYNDGQFIYEDSILADGLENVWWADLDRTTKGFFARKEFEAAVEQSFESIQARRKQFLDAVDVVCINCHYCKEEVCETCPVRKTCDEMSEVQE